MATLAGSAAEANWSSCHVDHRIAFPRKAVLAAGRAARARDDVSGCELFYLRPGNATSPDQLKRKHSVQYVAEPGFSWPLLRRAWPSLYEAYAPLEAGAWTHLKIEVTGRDGTPNCSSTARRNPR